MEIGQGFNHFLDNAKSSLEWTGLVVGDEAEICSPV